MKINLPCRESPQWLLDIVLLNDVLDQLWKFLDLGQTGLHFVSILVINLNLHHLVELLEPLDGVLDLLLAFSLHQDGPSLALNVLEDGQILPVGEIRLLESVDHSILGRKQNRNKTEHRDGWFCACHRFGDDDESRFWTLKAGLLF